MQFDVGYRDMRVKFNEYGDQIYLDFIMTLKVVTYIDRRYEEIIIDENPMLVVLDSD